MIFIHPEQHSKNIMQTKMRSFNKKEKNIEHLGKYPNTLTREWVLFMQQQSSLKEDQMSRTEFAKIPIFMLTVSGYNYLFF